MCVHALGQPPFARTSNAQRMHIERTAIFTAMHTDWPSTWCNQKMAFPEVN